MKRHFQNAQREYLNVLRKYRADTVYVNLKVNRHSNTFPNSLASEDICPVDCYLKCAIDIPIATLKKFIYAKFTLDPTKLKITLFNKNHKLDPIATVLEAWMLYTEELCQEIPFEIFAVINEIVDVEILKPEIQQPQPARYDFRSRRSSKSLLIKKNQHNSDTITTSDSSSSSVAGSRANSSCYYPSCSSSHSESSSEHNETIANVSLTDKSIRKEFPFARPARKIKKSDISSNHHDYVHETRSSKTRTGKRKSRSYNADGKPKPLIKRFKKLQHSKDGNLSEWAVLSDSSPSKVSTINQFRSKRLTLITEHGKDIHKTSSNIVNRRAPQNCPLQYLTNVATIIRQNGRLRSSQKQPINDNSNQPPSSVPNKTDYPVENYASGQESTNDLPLLEDQSCESQQRSTLCCADAVDMSVLMPDINATVMTPSFNEYPYQLQAPKIQHCTNVIHAKKTPCDNQPFIVSIQSLANPHNHYIRSHT